MDDDFARRHIGPDPAAVATMPATVGLPDLDGLVDAAVPAAIRTAEPLDLPPARAEHEVLAALRAIAVQNVGGAAANLVLPGAPDLPRGPQRDHDAAVAGPALRRQPRSGPHDDPARLVHDEAERAEMEPVRWPDFAGIHPVAPTESEDLPELDRFVEAMLGIRAEIDTGAQGRWPLTDSPLRRAPQPAETLLADHWDRPYPRSMAAYPVPRLPATKYWPRSAGSTERAAIALVCACLEPAVFAADFTVVNGGIHR